jgi:hypothetical protein
MPHFSLLVIFNDSDDEPLAWNDDDVPVLLRKHASKQASKESEFS